MAMAATTKRSPRAKRTAAKRAPAKREVPPPFRPNPEIVTFRERNLRPGERISFDDLIALASSEPEA